MHYINHSRPSRRRGALPSIGDRGEETGQGPNSNTTHMAEKNAGSAVVWAARCTALLLLFLVVSWVKKLGGVSTSPDVLADGSNSTDRLFNWHPILMVSGFAVLMTEAVLAYKAPAQVTHTRYGHAKSEARPHRPLLRTSDPKPHSLIQLHLQGKAEGRALELALSRCAPNLLRLASGVSVPQPQEPPNPQFIQPPQLPRRRGHKSSYDPGRLM